MHAICTYRAIVEVAVDLDAGTVERACVRAPEPSDDPLHEVAIRLDGNRALPGWDADLDVAHWVVARGGAIALSGTWRPNDDQRALGGDPDGDLVIDPAASDWDVRRYGRRSNFARGWCGVLEVEHRRAFREAVETHLEEVLRDLSSEDVPAPSAVTRHMPRQVAAACDRRLATRWFMCLSVMAWKVAQPVPLDPSCVAEELALHALVREARRHYELAGGDPDDAVWDEFIDLAFEDTDFLALFGGEGITADHEVDAALLEAYTDIREEAWFEPFRAERSLPHPLCMADAR